MATTPSEGHEKAANAGASISSPALEARHGRSGYDAQQSGGAPPDKKSISPGGPDHPSKPVPAIYLIEREAIRLRRKRSGALGKNAAEKVGAADSLEMYARPHESKSPDPPLGQRIANHVKALFWGESPKDLRDCPAPPRHIPNIANIMGLALSGGGIRSASFNLGFLQGLAFKGMLGQFDYLSTVSGGGFIGAWWSAWLSRQHRAPANIFPEAEELELQRRADTAVLIRETDTPTEDLEQPPDGSLSAKRGDPIHFVRLFSNYLTPKTGIMSPDTWRLIAFFIRSLLCTWLALVPLMFAAVLAVQSVFLFRSDTVSAFLYGADSGAGPDARLTFLAIPALMVLVAYATLVIIWIIETAASHALAAFAVALLVVAGWLVHWSNGGGSLSISITSWAALGSCAATIILFAIQPFLRQISNARDGTKPQDSTNAHDSAKPVQATAADRRTWLTQQQERLLKMATFGGVLLLAAAFGHDIVMYIFCGIDSFVPAAVKKAGGWGALLLTGVSGLYTLIKKAPSTTGQTAATPNVVGRVLMMLAPPLVVAALLLGLALLSHRFLLIVTPTLVDGLIRAAICLAVVEVVLAIYESLEDPDVNKAPGQFSWRRFVPVLLSKWVGQPEEDQASRWYHFFSPRGWVRIVAVSGIITVLGLRRDDSPDALMRAFVAMNVNMAAMAILAAVVLLSFSRLKWRVSLRSARPAVLLAIASVTATLCLIANARLIDLPGLAALLSVSVLIGGVIAFGWLADPNLISLHGFYKARLSRAYLGASNTARDNEDITDAAPGDDLPLKEVWNHDSGGPYHLINTSLNLVGGSDLATSQRLAENFVMSRYHCGSARAGYRCTAAYMSGDLSLATAVAISGAAVSPIMGSKSPSAALSLLLSLFNVRLGFWAPTPSGKRWYEGHARLWPFYLLRETLANTGTLGTYCYLTDGGHFDNTGLYALVERGCRTIVVCDCGADPKPSFEDIGNAIRRCRIDFGAEISLSVDDFVLATTAQGVGSLQVGRGKISYQPEHLRLLGLDERTENVGDILWIKPTVVKLSAADVRQYRRAHSDFPQQSTAEQWYDESQFESYRRLGYESALQAIPFVPSAAPPVQQLPNRADSPRE
jgi:hypothetical protein